MMSDGSPVSKSNSKVSTDGSPVTKSYTASSWDGSELGFGKSKSFDELSAEVREICERIDTDRNGSISKLELVAAVQKDPKVAAFVLPDQKKICGGLCGGGDEDLFDAVMEIFDVISGGKQRIKYADLAAHHKKAKNQPPEEKSEMSRIYEIIDADKSGSISKFEIIEAVKVKAEVAKFLLPHMESAQKVMESEEAFDEINSLFQTIAGGKKRIDFADFEAYFKKGQVPSTVRASAMERKDTRVFVIGPGFGQQLNPRQSGMVTTAGYQVQFFHGIPNPETKNFDALPYLEKIKEAIESFQPHVVCAASKGGVYMVGLWKAGYWRGPSLLLNAHPACTELPQDVPVVLAHGGNDEVYSTARERLEKLIATGTENKCFLYYTANSGRLPTGQCTRMGDKHNMESLLTRDCLPRLIDATLSEAGPEAGTGRRTGCTARFNWYQRRSGAKRETETLSRLRVRQAHIQRSWRERLSEERLEAEDYLGPGAQRPRRGAEDEMGAGSQKSIRPEARVLVLVFL
ncbi:unnamed protein product [Effrenium voratum]|uniref:EF-hand domain-containing protein n=1 Tax=Effrenium voratum TaxID=2562239 RepID=A0AA36N1D5_9DINO|nr:unnamed protein product [Effrenium voratum]